MWFVMVWCGMVWGCVVWYGVFGDVVCYGMYGKKNDPISVGPRTLRTSEIRNSRQSRRNTEKQNFHFIIYTRNPENLSH